MYRFFHTAGATPRILFRFLFPLILLVFIFSLPAFGQNTLLQLRRSILGRHENDPARNEALADQLNENGLADEAVFYYQRTLELRPDSASCRIKLARLLKKSGDLNGAVETYKQLIQQFPTDESLVEELAEIFAEQNNFDGAVETYRNFFHENCDIQKRIDCIARLADLALSCDQLPRLLDCLGNEDFAVSSPQEKVLLTARALIQGRRRAEARTLLEEARKEPISPENEAVPFFPVLLLQIAEEESDWNAAVTYQKEISRTAPSPENQKRLDALLQRQSESFDAHIPSYRANPSLFIQDLARLLRDPVSREGAKRFAVSFLKEIPLSEINANSFDGISLLFREFLFPNRKDWNDAVSLWKHLWGGDSEFSADCRPALAETLIGIDPKLAKEFTAELRNIMLHPAGLASTGYWSASGRESLLKTFLDSLPDTVLSELSSSESTDDELELRLHAAVSFRRGDSKEGLRLAQRLPPPKRETLSADWALFREMENSSSWETQEFLAAAYRDRIPLVAGFPDEKDVTEHYRKAAAASKNPNLCGEAAAPLLDELETCFKLAEQTDLHGNTTQTDPQTGETVSINIYELLNRMLESARELQKLGLSKEVAKRYHRYGEGKRWWREEEGQGIFYFEELKTIIEDSE